MSKPLKQPDMKKITFILLTIALAICFTNCIQKPSQDTTLSNPDSVKKIVIALNDECYHAYDNPKKFQSFCEDSMLVVSDDNFMTSSFAMSHDLNRISVYPHDYTFKLFGNTAVISYLITGYEILKGDTIFHRSRNLRTFAFNNGKWKVASNASGSQTVNYYKPVAEKNQKYYASYVGVYKVDTNFFDTIFVKGGKLYDRVTGDSNAYWNFPVNDNEYMTRFNLDRIVFGKDSKGVVAYYTDKLIDGRELKCLKVK
jgi:hypothetical protein